MATSRSDSKIDDLQWFVHGLLDSDKLKPADPFKSSMQGCITWGAIGGLVGAGFNAFRRTQSERFLKEVAFDAVTFAAIGAIIEYNRCQSRNNHAEDIKREIITRAHGSLAKN